MTKRQMRRIALAVEAHYILTGAGTDAVTDLLTDDEVRRFQNVQGEIAHQWLRQAGFKTEPGSLEDIFMYVLGEIPCADPQ